MKKWLIATCISTISGENIFLNEISLSNYNYIFYQFNSIIKTIKSRCFRCLYYTFISYPASYFFVRIYLYFTFKAYQSIPTLFPIKNLIY